MLNILQINVWYSKQRKHVVFGAASVLPGNVTALNASSVDTFCCYKSPSDLSND